MSMINCREFIGVLDDYVDGTMAPERAEEFEAHLRICPECRAYLVEYRTSIELVSALGRADPDSPVPESVPAGLLAAVRQAINPQG